MRKLRIGLLVNELNISAWEYEMLRKVLASGCAEVVLAIKRNSNIKVPLLKRLINRRNYLAYAALSSLERIIFKKALRPDALEGKDLCELLPGITVLNVTPNETAFCDRIAKSDIEKIKKYDIDILVRMGYKILKGEILTLAKYGVWSYHHGDNFVNRGGPPAFWEVVYRWPSTGFILQILTEDLDGGTVIERVNVATNKNYPSANHNSLLWKSADILSIKIRQLYDLGEDAFFKLLKGKNLQPAFYSNRLFKAPRNFNTVCIYFKIYLSFAATVIKNFLYKDQWFISFSLNKKDKPSNVMYKYKNIIPPKDRFWADPFVVSKNGKHYVFVEEYIYRNKIGHISVLELEKDGKLNKVTDVLKTPYHLSFPFIFEYNGDYYMVPDTFSNRTIELYKCEDFPYQWAFVKNLMEGVKATDSVLILREKRWWLFTSISTDIAEDCNHRLNIFYTKDENLLEAEWIPHPLNPVSTDVRKSRMAGKIQTSNGKIYRPSQDCSVRYGYGVVLNEITSLTEKEYKEQKLSEIYPLWDKKINGLHTLDYNDEITVIDAVRKIRRI